MKFTITDLSYFMLPKQRIIQYMTYINFYINAPAPPTLKIGGRNVQGAKRPGAKRRKAKRPRGVTSWGGNGFGNLSHFIPTELSNYPLARCKIFLRYGI